MKGNRGARGLARRVKSLLGINYTGDPAGVSAPWGGGAAGVSTPGIGQYPTVTLPLDENDDGVAPLHSRASGRSGSRAIDDTTAARLRTQLKTPANFIAWLMDVVAGTRSFKNIVVDGTGGIGGLVGAPGSISATGDAVIGGAVSVGATAGGIVVPTPAVERGKLTIESGLFAAAFINGGTALVGGFNIASFVRNSTGVCTVTLNTPATSATRVMVVGCVMTIPGMFEGLCLPADTITMSSYNASGVLVDTTFCMLAFHV